MAVLPTDLVSQFVKVTNDNTKPERESIVYGTTEEYAGKMYVRLDGSEDMLTPVATTTSVKSGERVSVMIKNHHATITGNVSSPAASDKDLQKIAGEVSEFEIVIAHKVTADEIQASTAIFESLKATTAKYTEMESAYATITELEAKYANLERVTAKDAEIMNAEIDNLEAEIGKFTSISAEDMEALHASIGELRGYSASFVYVSAEILQAVKASITQLETDKLSAKDAEIKYANIDFANIGELAIKRLFSETGIIKDLIVSEGKITGELVGVTIKGDLIEGGTVKADKLVVKGTDGLFYKLNFEHGEFKDGEAVPNDSLHGSVITAKSIVAEQIAVNDLVAFGANIATFKITENSIYSGVKDSATNTTRGIYLDNEGQLSIGDASNFLRYYKDADGSYKLAISASSVLLRSGSVNLETIAEKAEEDASDALARVGTVETIIQQLRKSIVTLVANGDDMSLMTQNGDGWSFNLTSLDGAVNDTMANLENLTNTVGDVKAAADILEQAVTDLEKTAEYVRIGIHNDEPCIELGEADSEFKLRITNTTMEFLDGENVVAYFSKQSMHIKKAVIEEELQQGQFVWKARSNGNLGLIWKGASS